MEEHDHSPDDAQHPPRWVPYTPPPLDGWDRVRFWVRRLSFPVVALLLVGGVAGLLYWTAQTEAERPSTPTVNVMPSTIGMGEGAERSVAAGQAPLLVRTTPPGAVVRVNGDSVGVTPFADSTRQTGVYMVSVQRKGHFRADTVVVLEAGVPATVRLALRQRPGYEEPPAADPGSSRPPASTRAARTPAERPLPVTSVPTPTPTPSPTPAPVFGALYVTSAPPGGVVTVNGTERGRTPLPLSQISPGPRQVSVVLDGYEPWSARVEVPADSTARVHAALEQRTGRLRVLARPWGTIYVDQTLHARESDIWYETQLPEGRHQVTVVHPALGEQTRQVGITAGETTEIVIDLARAEAETSP